MKKTKIRPIAPRLWLSANDPGLIRTLSAGRAALALLSIWLVFRTILRLLPGGSRLPIPLFGVLFGIVFLLFIIDLKPSDRKVSLWLAPIPFTGALILASTMADNFWLKTLILLLLFFFAYFFRRYGARAGELALVATVGYYFGFLLEPPPEVYPWLLACVAASALFIYLWQFVLIPYDPAKLLVRSVRTFYHNVARGVGSVRQGLDSNQETAPNRKVLHNHLMTVHRNRRMIEGLFSAAVSPAVWSQPRLNQLQQELFKTESGLELLIEAAGMLSTQRGELPGDIRNILTEGLAVLEDQLWEMDSGQGQARLSEAGEWLQAQVKSSLAEKPGGEWVIPLLRIGMAARQLARSVASIHAIEIAWKESASDAPLAKPPAGAQPPVSRGLAKKAGFTLHPTTILGLQAVLATGLAMVAAYLLKMDQPNLVFWTAFVVIAGSTGESLRRITLRILGVITGTLIGVALAIILPEDLTLIVLLVTTCLFLSIYSLTTSYFWMIFWLNIAVLLIITNLGGAALELLVLRTVSTLLGGAIAAIVVFFVLPIHVQDRFRAALAEFMSRVDEYVETYVENLVNPTAIGDLGVEELKIDASYKKLELTLPGVVYEYNPLSRSQSQLASQGTSLAVLKGYVTHLNDDVGAEPGSLEEKRGADLIRDIQAQIHLNVGALNHRLAQGPGEEQPPDLPRQAIPEITGEDISSLDGGSDMAMRNRAIYHLNRINDTISQITASL